jgi:hypothetical protein
MNRRNVMLGLILVAMVALVGAIVERSPRDVGAAVGAIFITENRDVYVTPGLRAGFRLTDKTFSLKGW